MRVLVACEFSGVVRDAFRKRGHQAFSCDLLQADHDPEFHIEGDVLRVIRKKWDLMIAHPPCTYLTSSGLHRNWQEIISDYDESDLIPFQEVRGRVHATEESLLFVEQLLNAPIPRIALENPIGHISSRIRKPDQIIQPYQFGHPESKSTCLWLKGLPRLRPTNILKKPASGRWENQTASGQNKLAPSADRWKIRSITYQGIADAMAEQWG